MSWKWEVASNKAASAWTDFTSVIDRRTWRAGGVANKGDTDAASGFDVDDDSGAYDFPTRRVVRLIEDATTPDTTLFRGRIVSSGIGRGTRHFGNAMSHDVMLVDYNADLGGIPLSRWTRPAETGSERLQALMAFLGGNPRASTVLTDDYIAEPDDDDLDAYVYEDTNPAGVISHIVGETGKECFVTVDGEMFYDDADSTAYAAGLSITDSSPNLTTSFPPIWEGDAATLDGTEFFGGVTVKWSRNRRTTVIDQAAEDARDFWRTSYTDETIRSVPAATKRGNALLSEHADDNKVIKCALKLHRTKVDLVKWGQTLSFRAAAARETTPVTLRVKRLIWEPLDPEYYLAHLELAWPTKLSGFSGGTPSQNPEPFDPIACADDPTLVQQSPVAYSGADCVLPANPTAGNLLVFVEETRQNTGTEPLVPAGFTTADWSFTTLGAGNNGSVKISYRIADATDTTTIISINSGADRAYVCYEFSGIDSVAAAASNDDQTSATPMTTGSVTPDAGAKVLLLGVVMKSFAGPAGGTTLPDMDISAPATELDWTGTIATDNQGPTMVTGYRVIASASGSYTMSATTDTSGFANGQWGSVLVAFVCSNAGETPSNGQPVNESIACDGLTDDFQTNYPYAAGTLIVTVGGINVIPDETDPAAGEFSLPFIPPVGSCPIVRYQATGGEGTGAGNSHTIPSTVPTIPPDVLAQDFLTVRYGGGDVLDTHGAAGATETIDLADGNVHDVTLDQNASLTFAGATAGKARSFSLFLRQDGTGGWTVTWPGSVVWSGGFAPTLSTDADAVDVLTFITLDGGVIWYGFALGGSSGLTCVPLMDGLGNVVTDVATGEAIMACS